MIGGLSFSKRTPKSVFAIFFCLLIVEAPGPPQIEPKSQKIRKKTFKNQRQKKTYFWTPFFIDFSSFWPPKMDPKSSFFRIFCENDDLAKISKNHRKNNGFWWFLRVWASKNPTKIDAKTLSQKTSKKNLSKIDFALGFGLQKPPQTPPKSNKNALQSDVQRSLFCDAMEIAKKSAEGNGSRRL